MKCISDHHSSVRERDQGQSRETSAWIAGFRAGIYNKTNNVTYHATIRRFRLTIVAE